MGIHGPWMMCTLYIILLGLTLSRRWHRGAWKKIVLFKDVAPIGGAPITEPAMAATDADSVMPMAVENAR